MMSFLFSPSGRISRKQLWLGLLGLFAIVVVTAMLSLAGAFALGPQNPASIAFIGLMFLSYLVLAVGLIMLQIKRLHDLNKSGFWLLAILAVSVVAQFALVGMLNLSPETMANPEAVERAIMQQIGNPVVLALVVVPGLVGFVFFIYTGFFQGTVGANRFGEDPVMRA